MGLAPRRRRPSARALLEDLGGSGSRERLDAYTARGPGAAIELLDELADPSPPVRRLEAHPSDILYWRQVCLAELARTHPDAFVAGLERHPELRRWPEVLAALAPLGRPRVTSWLLEALSDRAGDCRRVAALVLVDRCEPALVPRLRDLLGDRSDAVGAAAAGGLRRWGGPGDLAALEAYAARALPGNRELALDAVESICERAGLPLPAGHPGPRLVAVEVPGGGEPVHGVTTALLVPAGFVLARGAGGEPVTAPSEGVVAALDRGPDGRLERIVLRRQAPASPAT